MKRAMHPLHRGRSGSAFTIALIFLVMFGALAAALAALSANNIQIADNLKRSNGARAAAESGMEITHYWLGRIKIPSSTPPADYLSTIITLLRNDLEASLATNMVVQNNGTIENVTLDSTRGTSFSAQLQTDPTDPSMLLVSLTGVKRGLSRTIRVGFRVEPYEHPIFNYGMATKGAIFFPRNPTLTGATLNWEADVYVDTLDMIAIDIGGNANFDGNFTLRNPAAQFSYAGDLQIAGDHGQTAIENHVVFGAPPVDFPTPDVQTFAGCVNESAVNWATINLSKGVTLTNARIPANTNPTFGGSVTINGILWIDSPNVVTFGANCQLNGVIVGDGCIGSTGGNQINFVGNFGTGPYPQGADFAALQSLVGTSIVAPGFPVSFTGNFSAIDGVVAVSGATFSANASAQVRGTIINYSSEPTVVNGNISMNFDRAQSTKIPGGFDTLRVLEYQPATYAEVIL
jgi:hypothetical protein